MVDGLDTTPVVVPFVMGAEAVPVVVLVEELAGTGVNPFVELLDPPVSTTGPN